MHYIQSYDESELDFNQGQCQQLLFRAFITLHGCLDSHITLRIVLFRFVSALLLNKCAFLHSRARHQVMRIICLLTPGGSS